MKHELKIRVRFSDTDKNGHVNNAVYATYMEEARIDFLDTLFSQNKLGLILASSKIDYRAQTFYPEHLYVITYLWITKIGNRSFDCFCEIRSEDGKLLCDGTATVVHFDYAQARAVPLPDYVRRELEKFMPIALK